MRALIDTALLLLLMMMMMMMMLLLLLLHTCSHSFFPERHHNGNPKAQHDAAIVHAAEILSQHNTAAAGSSRPFQSLSNAKALSRIIRVTTHAQRLSSCCCLLQFNTSQCEFAFVCIEL